MMIGVGAVLTTGRASLGMADAQVGSGATGAGILGDAFRIGVAQWLR